MGFIHLKGDSYIFDYKKSAIYKGSVTLTPLTPTLPETSLYAPNLTMILSKIALFLTNRGMFVRNIKTAGINCWLLHSESSEIAFVIS